MLTPRAIELRIAAVAGPSLASLRACRRELSRELRARTGAEVLSLVETLLRRERCPRWFAYELVHHHAGAMDQLTAADLDWLGAGLADWGTVDAFAVYLLGPAYRERRITKAELARWARSEDRFRRRAALACTVALNTKARGGRGDAPRTLAVCDLLRDDRDDLVLKAMSWALRELALRCPEEVASYIERNQSALARRVTREVTNKLHTGKKNGVRAG